MIVAEYSLGQLESMERPMLHHRLKLQMTASGFGRRLPTTKMVRLPGSRRWRRVYCCLYSNSGTCYVEVPGGWAVILD